MVTQAATALHVVLLHIRTHHDTACPLAGTLHTFTPSELAQLMWAAARQLEESHRAGRRSRGLHESSGSHALHPALSLGVAPSASFSPSSPGNTAHTPTSAAALEALSPPPAGANTRAAVAAAAVPALDAAAVAAQHTAVLGALVPHVAVCVGHMDADALVMVAWAAGSARVGHDELFDAVVSAAAPRAHRMNDVGLATLMWMGARLGRPSPHLLKPVCRALGPAVGDMSTGPLSMALWALGTLQATGGGAGGQGMVEVVGQGQAKLVDSLAMAVRLKLSGYVPCLVLSHVACGLVGNNFTALIPGCLWLVKA